MLIDTNILNFWLVLSKTFPFKWWDSYCVPRESSWWQRKRLQELTKHCIISSWSSLVFFYKCIPVPKKLFFCLNHLSNDVSLIRFNEFNPIKGRKAAVSMNRTKRYSASQNNLRTIYCQLFVEGFFSPWFVSVSISGTEIVFLLCDKFQESPLFTSKFNSYFYKLILEWTLHHWIKELPLEKIISFLCY